MLSIITSYLLQAGKCALPHIGLFKIEYKSAVNDGVNKQFIPPSQEIVFIQGAILLSPELTSYIALKKGIDETIAATELDSFCKNWKDKIIAGEVLRFDTLGTLQKNKSGDIFFSADDDDFYYSVVPADRVLRQNTEHNILVGDTQTTSAVMNKYYSEEPVVAERNNWKVWALVLFLTAVLILFFSFYNNKLSTASVGNRNSFTIDTAGETHFELSK